MFSRPAKESGTAYRPLPKESSLKGVFCFKGERVVAGNNTISYNGRAFQILSNGYRSSYCKAKVKVHEYLDGSVNIFYQGKKLKHKPVSKEKIKSFNRVIQQKETELVALNY